MFKGRLLFTSDHKLSLHLSQVMDWFDMILISNNIAIHIHDKRAGHRTFAGNFEIKVFAHCAILLIVLEREEIDRKKG